MQYRTTPRTLRISSALPNINTWPHLRLGRHTQNKISLFIQFLVQRHSLFIKLCFYSPSLRSMSDSVTSWPLRTKRLRYVRVLHQVAMITIASASITLVRAMISTTSDRHLGASFAWGINMLTSAPERTLNC